MALRCVMLNTRQRVEEFRNGGAPWCCYSGKWQHHFAPLMFQRKRGSVQEKFNMIHYPKAAKCLFTRLRAEESSDFKMAASQRAITFWRNSKRVQEELEFKKSSTWSTILGLQHVYFPICGRKSPVTSSRNIAMCLHAKDLMKLLFLWSCVCLIYDILEYVYPSACDKEFCVQLDPNLVQRTYIFCMYISKLIATQSSSPYTVVRVSTSKVIVIVLLI